MLSKMSVRVLLLSLALGAGALAAESLLVLAADSQMRLEGTSNVRKWDADITALEATLVLAPSAGVVSISASPDFIEQLSLRLPVAGIKSGTKGLSGKIHKHLKKDKHPEIAFTLEEVTGLAGREDGYLVTGVGTINAAGVDHPVAMEVDLARDAQGRLVFSGSKALKMTDFAIKPPTAFFGAMRADDEVVVHFKLVFTEPEKP